MKKSSRMRLFGVVSMMVGAIMLVTGAYLLADRVRYLSSMVSIDIRTIECRPGYVFGTLGNCFLGYDPRKEQRAPLTTYEEFSTYGSAPFRRGDAR